MNESEEMIRKISEREGQMNKGCFDEVNWNKMTIRGMVWSSDWVITEIIFVICGDVDDRMGIVMSGWQRSGKTRLGPMF